MTARRDGAPLRSVLIVGGGTAGWMTAAYLGKMFGETLEVTLVESDAVPKIGVGEATVPNLQRVLFDALGIPEAEWMRAVNGAFKTAVKFVGWRGGDDIFYHPFGILPEVDGVPLPQYWFHLTEGRGRPVDYACFPSAPLMDAKRSPKWMDGTSAVPHAWHFDAHLVAAFLADWAQARGVRRVVDGVVDVEMDAQGFIQAVRTESGARLVADFFVDCTGFRGLLIHGALGEPFVSSNDALLCDSAVALAIPHADEALGIEPYTSAIAMRSGWTWKIPMMGRFGAGYVYSSHHADEASAVRDLCALFDLREEDCEFNRIRFRTGRCRRAWVKNCVAIGLSSAFLEPLESTGIYFITAAIHQLAKHFPKRDFDEELANEFNRSIERMFEDCKDFVQAHYLTSPRRDTPFWRAQGDLRVSDGLSEKLALYRAGLPVCPPAYGEETYYGSFDAEFRNFWTNGSYYAVLAGMGHLPARPMPRLAYRRAAVREAESLLQEIREKQTKLANGLPSNFEYLRTLHRGTDAASQSPALAKSRRRTSREARSA